MLRPSFLMISMITCLMIPGRQDMNRFGHIREYIHFVTLLIQLVYIMVKRSTFNDKRHLVRFRSIKTAIFAENSYANPGSLKLLVSGQYTLYAAGEIFGRKKTWYNHFKYFHAAQHPVQVPLDKLWLSAIGMNGFKKTIAIQKASVFRFQYW